jgi:hypothetical protein
VNGEHIVKWFGFGCMIAGIVRMGMTPSSLIWGFNNPVELGFGIAACILMSFVTLAFYLVQSHKTGVLGLITVLGIMIGNMLTTCILWGFIVYGEFADENGLVNSITGIVANILVLGGTLIFAIQSWFANVFPRWNVILLIIFVGSLAVPIGHFFAFLWGLTYVILGTSIWTGKLNQSFSSSSRISA